MIWNNKRVLVTGGANGIGQGIVREFATQGAQVIFTDIDRTAALTLEKELQEQGKDVVYRYLDSSDLEAVESFLRQFYQEFGKLNILINNVGISYFKSLTEMTTEEFLTVQKINYISGYLLSKNWVKLREEQGLESEYGRIIWIASTRHLMSEPGSEAYAASKGAIVSLTHALAASTWKHNLTVNAISPGWIETKDYASLTKRDHQQHWSGRVGKPEDIASLCRYLCEEDNNFINGQNFYVDGGMTKRMIYEE